MQSKLGVAVWGTGNMGATSIRSVTAFPGLRLTGVITSSEDKAGRDAARFAGLDSDTGVAASTDVDATFDAVQASGAEVIQEPIDQPYGLRDCAFRDPAGNTVRIRQGA